MFLRGHFLFLFCPCIVSQHENILTGYRGAFGTDDWTAGWTNFNPDTSAYTMGIYPTSATHTLLADQIIVYSNPVKDQSTVTLSYSAKENTQVEWELMTITGTVVSKGNYTQHSGNNSVNIPVNHIENGLFFLQLKTTQETRSIKLTCIK